MDDSSSVKRGVLAVVRWLTGVLEIRIGCDLVPKLDNYLECLGLGLGLGIALVVEY